MALLRIERISRLILHFSFTDQVLCDTRGKIFHFTQKNLEERLGEYGNDIRPLTANLIRHIMELKTDSIRPIDRCVVDTTSHMVGFPETLIISTRPSHPIDVLKSYLKAFISSALNIDNTHIDDRSPRPV